MNQVLVICGPTATGKTKLALNLAEKFNGELISADSRQIYKGMDIGTGKDIPQNSEFIIKNPELHLNNQEYTIGYYFFGKIPLWLYDIAYPNQEFSVSYYHKYCCLVLKDIWQRKKLPILVGGTGFYLKSVIDGFETLGIKKDISLREKLEKKTVSFLQQELTHIDKKRFLAMNHSDKFNKRRLVRAIEVGIEKKKSNYQKNNKTIKMDCLMIGLTLPLNELKKQINKRVNQRVRQGITEEIKSLLNQGYSFDLPSLSGLGYRQWRQYFTQGENKEEAIKNWKIKELAYAKRQLTWFNKDKRIYWFDMKKDSYQKIVAKISSWL